MTVQLAQITAVPVTSTADSEFDLDVSIVESGPVIAELMRLTDETSFVPWPARRSRNHDRDT